MKIYIGTDHVGYELKEKLKTYLPQLGLGYEVVDMGDKKMDEEDDYPDFCRPTAEAVVRDVGSMGIVLGGSGQGEAMSANKVAGARAIVFYGPKMAVGERDVSGSTDNEPFEIIKLGREHNDANILSIGVRFMSEDEAKFAIELFLSTKFGGEERHVRRIGKLE